MKKPDGLTIIRPEDIPAKLYALALRDIPGIGYRILKRLHLAGINTVEKLYECSSGHLQTIWGSIYGKKCWYLLRGYEFSSQTVKNKVIGHSRILAPEIRNVNVARNIASELILKAAKRLRARELYTSYIGLYIKTPSKVTYKAYVKIPPSCDNSTILIHLLNTWDSLTVKNKVSTLHQVAVSLSDLIEKPRQLSFDELATTVKKKELSIAMDKINNRFGSNIISLGMPSTEAQEPIAFAHIPGVNTKEYLG